MKKKPQIRSFMDQSTVALDQAVNTFIANLKATNVQIIPQYSSTALLIPVDKPGAVATPGVIDMTVAQNALFAIVVIWWDD